MVRKFIRIVIWIAVGCSLGIGAMIHFIVTPGIDEYSNLVEEFIMDSANVIAQYQGALMHTRFENVSLNLEVLLMCVDDKDAVLNDLWQSTMQTVGNISEHVETSILEHDDIRLSTADRLQLLHVQYGDLSAEDRKYEIRALANILESLKKSLFFDELRMDDINMQNNQRQI